MSEPYTLTVQNENHSPLDTELSTTILRVVLKLNFLNYHSTLNFKCHESIEITIVPSEFQTSKQGNQAYPNNTWFQKYH